jgi:hypothetical protein
MNTLTTVLAVVVEEVWERVPDPKQAKGGA